MTEMEVELLNLFARKALEAVQGGNTQVALITLESMIRMTDSKEEK